MKHSNCLANYWILTVVIAALVVAQGCGTGEYEKRMQAKRWAGKSAGRGVPAGPKTEVPGMAATFSPPAGLEAMKTPTAPPGTNLPGLKAAYEGFVVDTQQGKRYYACYLIGADPGPDPMDSMLKSLEGAIQGGTQWAKSANGPDGKPAKIRTASARGMQKFRYVTAAGAEQFSETDGTFNVWDCEIQPGGAHLFIVWRVPSQLATKDYANPEGRGAAMALSVAPK